MEKIIRIPLRLSSKPAKVIFTLIAILCVAAVAWLLRARGVERLPLDHDERIYVFVGRYFAAALQSGNFKAIPKYSTNFEHPDFVKLVYGVVLYFTQDQLPTFNKQGFIVGERLQDGLPAKPMVVTSRQVSAVFGVLAAALLAAINPLAGLFLAIHTYAVKYTSVAYLEAIPSFTTLVSILAYIRWEKAYLRKPQRVLFKKIPTAYAWLGLSAVALGLSAASKYLYGIVGLAIVCYALWQAFSRRQALNTVLAGLFVWGLVALAAFFAADPYLWPDPIHRLHGSLAFSAAYSTSEQVQSWNYPVWQPLIWFSRPVTGQNPAAIPFLPGDFLIAWDVPINFLAILGLPRLFKRNPIFAVWLFISLAFLLAWNTKWPQYGMILLAPLCLAAAQGVATLLLPFWRLINRLGNRSAKALG
jgi:hypothetical protein